MDYKENYKKWLADVNFDEATRAELAALTDDEEIKERFYKDLEFGTAGLRGVIGAGTNRMNIYTVRKATQGFANYIINEKPEGDGIAISFDPRNMSKEFARETALVFNANGIKTYIYKGLRPTPQLSFTVRKLKTAGGVMITASHNPPEYNGYKVYGPDGGQVVSPADEQIITCVNNIKDFGEIKTMSLEDAKAKGLYIELDDDMDEDFIETSLGLSLKKDDAGKDIKIIYTPLHGAGLVPIEKVLERDGFTNVTILPEQAKPDGNFPTVEYPNPEDPKAFALGIKLAKEIDADMVIGSDPDADRIGIITKDDKGEYIHLNGNIVGVLLANYILSKRKEQGTLPNDPAIITSIVSSKMTKVVAEHYGAHYFEVFTGFKHVAQQIKKFTKENYIYSFEESYGYMTGDHVRDKDAVGMTMLACEMVADYKAKGKTLYQGIQDLYAQFGFYKEETISLTIKGITGTEKILRIMDHFTNNVPEQFNGSKVVEYRNYKTEIIKNLVTGEETSTHTPSSNVRYFVLEDGTWVCVRPSGTEPKIKFYVGVTSDSTEKSSEKIAAIKKEILAIVDEIE